MCRVCESALAKEENIFEKIKQYLLRTSSVLCFVGIPYHLISPQVLRSRHYSYTSLTAGKSTAWRKRCSLGA